MGWQLHYEDLVISNTDVTIGEASTVSQIVGRSGWENCDPGSAPDVLGAWCVIAEMRRGKSMQDAMIIVNGASLMALAQGYVQTPDELQPPMNSNGMVDEDALAQLREMAAASAHQAGGDDG